MTQKYHAHIYFQSSQVSLAKALYLGLETILGDCLTLGKMHSNPVGPHPLPMFTVMFDQAERQALIEFLLRHGVELSVLIHEDTGDDYRDHTEGAEWLGEKVPLNFDHFERIKHEKHVLVFPE